MPATPAGLALIVGASRGLGLGLVREHLARGWQVIGTVRGDRPTPLHELQADSALAIETVDINLQDQVAALRQRLNGRALDMLFVNAGVANGPAETLAGTSTDEFMRVMVTNALSPMRVVEAFADLVRPDGVIAVMSSGLGSVTNNVAGGWEVYRASKAALNTLMRSFAARHASDTRTKLIITPGWVRTDMGGAGATLDVATSTRGIADTIAARRGTAGVAFVDYRGQTVAW
jgi:NAD(P)-dependent dehydrogenase (short-subunit alcohol dehydrogenase family)